MARIPVFVSHAAKDRAVAIALKEFLTDAYVGFLEIFVSSDEESIPIGSSWFDAISKNLKSAKAVIVLISPNSLFRPWIYFEAGAAWHAGKHLLPICIQGLRTDEVGPPLNTLQIRMVLAESDVLVLCRDINRIFNVNMKPDSALLSALLDLVQPNIDALPLPLSPLSKAREGLYMSELTQEWNTAEMGAHRRVFWEIADQTYAAFRSIRADVPVTLEALADRSNVPLTIPLPKGEELREYRMRHGRLLSGFDATLFQFCTLVYPAKDPSRKLSQCSLVDEGDFESFHNARRALATFWHQWARRIYTTEQLEMKTVVEQERAHYRLLKLLTYLEICLTEWTQDEGQGKLWLFRLTRDWTRV